MAEHCYGIPLFCYAGWLRKSKYILLECVWQLQGALCFSVRQLYRTALCASWSNTTYCASCWCTAWQPFYWLVNWVFKTNRMTSKKSWPYSMWHIFVVLGKRGSVPSKTKNTWLTGTTNLRSFCHYSSQCHKQNCWMFIFQLQTCVHSAAACVEIWH
jgi:hypothetical protein